MNFIYILKLFLNSVISFFIVLKNNIVITVEKSKSNAIEIITLNVNASEYFGNIGTQIYCETDSKIINIAFIVFAIVFFSVFIIGNSN